jgi:hypothetical protein
MKRILVLSLTLLLIAPWVLEAGNNQQRNQVRCCQSTVESALLAGSLDESETADLLFMREEEKLAHDLYRSFFNAWGNPFFEKITLSESRHMAAVLRAIIKYGLDDPAAGNAIGIFTNQYIQQLYSDLFLAGSQSLNEALKAGALVEEKDIFDLGEAIDTTNNLDLEKMYSNLLRGSGSHLRAFVRNLAKRGVAYEPQILSQKDFDSIIAAGRK